MAPVNNQERNYKNQNFISIKAGIYINSHTLYSVTLLIVHFLYSVGGIQIIVDHSNLLVYTSLLRFILLR